MRVYTIQTIGLFEELLQNGVAYCNKESWICKTYQFQYDWMASQMRKRIGTPPIEEIKYPIWVWQQYNSKKDPKPRMSPKEILKGENEAVMLELDVPDDAVLLSDLDLWISPLNGWEICSKKESRQFDKEKQYTKRNMGNATK